jgi:hypothetical protein
MSARWCIIFQQASQFPVQDLAHRVVSTPFRGVRPRVVCCQKGPALSATVAEAGSRVRNGSFAATLLSHP